MARAPKVQDVPDPLRLEYLRPRGSLRPITLHVEEVHIELAKECSALMQVPYQALLRLWVAIGAAENVRRRTRQRRRDA
jgi:hypothetical protein